MANPKRKHSKARSRKKRTHKRIVPPDLVVCPQCKNLKQPFQICPFCGYYKGKQIISIKEEDKRVK